MRQYRALALIAGLGMAAGCSGDLLNTVPIDRISDELFWKTEQDFTYAINAGYRELVRAQGGGRVQEGPYYDLPSDIGYSQQYWAQMSDVARGLINAASGPQGGVWNGSFQALAKVNEVLAQLDAVAPGVLSETAAKQIEGQAHFLRGYYYHRLLWHFGGVPLLTTVLTPQEAAVVTRATRDEVYAFIMTELDEAASLLPSTWPAAQAGRATKGAALAIKARTALYEASTTKYVAGNAAAAQPMFQTAAAAAEAVMATGVYSLDSNFAKLFTVAGENSAEVILAWQVNPTANGADWWYDFAPRSLGGSEVALAPTRALVDMFYMKDGLLPSQSPLYDPAPPKINYAGTVATTESLGMYANRDPRFYATMLFPGATNFDGAVYNSYPHCDNPAASPGYCSQSESEAWDPSNFYNTPTGYLPRKYLDIADRANRENSGINFIIMRYADVLLMHAEAKIELGEVGAGVNSINLVRRRAGIPDVPAGGSQAAMFQLLQNERAVELAFEGLRFPDLRRWKMAEQVVPGFAYGFDYDLDKNGTWEPVRSDVARVFQSPRDYLFPIPATERDLNPNLTQNPGW